jgi:hypothetical protein
MIIRTTVAGTGSIETLLSTGGREEGHLVGEGLTLSPQFKGSGIGRHNGIAGFDPYLDTKSLAWPAR